MRARLQKILAAAGLASRRGAEEVLRAGRVTVNGAPAALGDSADPDCDEIAVDGRPIEREPSRYWMLHKPRGVLTTLRDPHASRDGRPLVLDLLPAAARTERLFPVGRLDLDSEGLLLLTNDGEAAQALLHPSLGTEREYVVTVRGQLSDETAERLARGIELDDGPMAPCRVGRRQRRRDPPTTRFSLTLREGRKRQIRRALRALGHPVVRLVRTRMGPLRLGDLSEGEARPLDARELAALRTHVGGRVSAEGRPAEGGRQRRAGSRPKSKQNR